jgi:hypothetical protein
VGLKGAGGSANPDDVSTAGANAVSDEARSERVVDRRETTVARTATDGSRESPGS